jgi:ribosome-binding ATPase YchF (GTP1/OBG family)
VDPASDIATVDTELILADLQTVDARLAKLAKERRMHPEAASAIETTSRAREILDSGRTIAAAASQGAIEPASLADLHLLTAKPFIYVFNVDEDQVGDARCRQ